ncbi:MAG: AAA family ATPase [Armatimonadota bacterium]
MEIAELVNTTEFAQRISQVIDEIETVIIGKRNTITLVMTAILCNGHILIEDVPGVGKTTLAKSMAKALGCTFKRIQFTPDLLPADITGTSIFNQKTVEFEFRPGPIFTQFVIADEINRATPKTQSSLLECMGENQVTVDGITYILPTPFFVIATQNNVEHHGTYQLPEAQMDRFFMRLEIGYPSRAEESLILNSQSIDHPINSIKTILSAEEVLDLQRVIKSIHLEPVLQNYIIEITSATRSHPMVSLGSSPRGSLTLAHAARALAAINGRNYVLPDDIKSLTIPVLAHRLTLKPEARIKNISEKLVIKDIISKVPVPC